MWLTREKHSTLRDQHMQRPWGSNKPGVSEEQKGARLVFGEQGTRPQGGGGARSTRPLDCGERSWICFHDYQKLLSNGVT